MKRYGVEESELERRTEECYARFSLLGTNVRERLIGGLTQPFVRPTEYFREEGLFANGYYYALATSLARYLGRRGVPLDGEFGAKLQHSFRENSRGGTLCRDALLQMTYGRIWGDHVPDEIFRNFDEGWDALYFLAGIWLSKNSPAYAWQIDDRELRKWPIHRIVGEYMQLGVHRLNKYMEEIGKNLPHKDFVQEKAAYLISPPLQGELPLAANNSHRALSHGH